MKRLGLAVLAVLFCLVFVKISWSGSKIISGYPSGEFAIKGPISIGLTILIEEIRGEQQSNPNCQLYFTVVGSADSTGVSAKNDKLAKERAEEIAEVLESNFPGAKINTWSTGDADNAKQVRVDWKFVPVEKAVPLVSAPVLIPQTELEERERQSKKLFFLLKLLLGLVIFSVFFLWFILALSSHHRKRMADKEETRVIHLVIEGVRYSVPLKNKGGMWFTPFMTLENPDVPLFRANFQDAKKVVKGCLRHEKYAGQKEELIKSRVIGVIKVTEL